MVGSSLGLFGPLSFAFLTTEFGEAHENLVDFLPLLRILCLELRNELRLRSLLRQVGFEHLKESFFFTLALALSVNRHVLFVGLIVVEFLQGDMALTNAHLLVGSDNQILDLSAEQVLALAELHDWHERSKNVDERDQVQFVQILNCELAAGIHGILTDSVLLAHDRPVSHKLVIYLLLQLSLDVLVKVVRRALSIVEYPELQVGEPGEHVDDILDLINIFFGQARLLI